MGCYLVYLNHQRNRKQRQLQREVIQLFRVINTNYGVSLEESTDNGKTWCNVHCDCPEGVIDALPDFVQDPQEVTRLTQEILRFA